MRLVRTFAIIILMGVAPAGSLFGSANAATLSFDLDVLNFGQVEKFTTSATLSIGLSVSGILSPTGSTVDQILDLLGPLLPFPDPAFAFQLDGCPSVGGQLAGDFQCTVDVTFSPSAVGFTSDVVKFGVQITRTDCDLFSAPAPAETCAGDILDTSLASVTVTAEGAFTVIGEGVITIIPLPAALPLYGTGLAVMGFIGWRKRKAAA